MRNQILPIGFMCILFCIGSVSKVLGSEMPGIPVATEVIANGMAANSDSEWVIKASTDPRIFFWYLPPAEKWIVQKYPHKLEVCHQTGCFELILDRDGDLYTPEKKKKKHYFSEHSVIRMMYNATMNRGR